MAPFYIAGMDYTDISGWTDVGSERKREMRGMRKR